MSSLVEIGVDTGGTFTDVVLRQPGGVRTVKIPSTPADPGRAILAALSYAHDNWGIDPAQIGRIVHGTTVATNAVLERKGAAVGLIATKGFGDTIDIGRQFRREMYHAVMEQQTPAFLMPGRRRREVTERIGASGAVLTPLDEEEVRRAVGELVGAGVESFAVSFLFSFLNPAHELRVAEIIEEMHPGVPVSLSHVVNPAFREYERTVATGFDAYVKPLLNAYLSNLETGLRRRGVTSGLQVMQSRGGISSSEMARQRPIRLFLSGPAAGVVGGRMAGMAAATHDLITVDIGGTSSDIALISDGKPLLREEGLVDGFPIRVSMVDVNAIGAGGGSLAWIDGAGGLRVGPQSAGSNPGPACYALGGTQATVTDASLILGYLDPDYFAGGFLKLDAALAREAVERTVARPLAMSVEAAAAGIHRVVNAQMAEGIRLVSIRQGFDARQFTLVPLGGAGGLHACALADELLITRIIVPLSPGVLSAAGLLASPIEHEVQQSVQSLLDDLSAETIRARLDDLDSDCAELMRAEKVPEGSSEISYFARMCFVGQSYDLDVPVADVGPRVIDRLKADFIALHERIYGYATESVIRVVALKTVHRAFVSREADAARPLAGGDPVKGERLAHMLDGYSGPVKVYNREKLAPGATIAGPAIVEQSDTTILIASGWSAGVLADGTMFLTRG